MGGDQQLLVHDSRSMKVKNNCDIDSSEGQQCNSNGWVNQDLYTSGVNSQNLCFKPGACARHGETLEVKS